MAIIQRLDASTEFSKVAVRIAIGFIVMGFFDFFVKLFFVPINNIIVGFDNVCKEVECGKGTCKSSNNNSFFFECECDLGWKQALSNETDLKFLPCIVPNCTMD